MNEIAMTIAAIAVAALWNPALSIAKGLYATLSKPDAVVRPVPVAPKDGATPTFAEAIEALAVVRNRLVVTGCADEKAAAAVEAVTHALVAGTDK